MDNAGGAAFSLSAGGVLVYRSGVQTGRRLVWMDRRGKESPALEDIRDYGDTWLSPDGARLAFDMAEGSGKGDIWIRDLARGVTSRFTFDPEREFAPLWSPDGRSIVYAKNAGTSWDLYVKDAAGTGEGKVLLANTQQKFPTDWSKDGRYLIYNESGKDTNWDLWALPMTGDNRTPIALNATRFGEFGGSLSPDGKYLAYRSNESGRNQVYVQEFPEARSKWQVSSQWRLGSVLEGRWPRALLPRARPEHHGRPGAGRCDVLDRHARGAVPGPLFAREFAGPLPCHARRPTLPGVVHTGPGRDSAGHGGAELDRRPPVDARSAT